MDEMTFWESMQERWQAYKKPILWLFWSNVLYAIFGSRDCEYHACRVSNMTTLQQWVFHILMFFNVIICPIWIKLIALKRRTDSMF
ncbi:hypothetical protein SAMN02746062_02236 [Alysiella filiformis DSM 16848]|uniref:Uncharacterized protein n=2 Tax=Alysiella TaxID=194195 RepID=A0A286EPJ0_9NEIS|nr:hypothetical protein SAMN02746062_02236 [Alysiella filiformis DSM 16848]